MVSLQEHLQYMAVRWAYGFPAMHSLWSFTAMSYTSVCHLQVVNQMNKTMQEAICNVTGGLFCMQHLPWAVPLLALANTLEKVCDVFFFVLLRSNFMPITTQKLTSKPSGTKGYR